MMETSAGHEGAPKRRRWAIRAAIALAALAILLTVVGPTETLDRFRAHDAKALEDSAKERNPADQVTQSRPADAEVNGPIFKYPRSLMEIARCTLKYPIGIDTAAYWGNGRFCIMLNSFHDMSIQGITCIFDGIDVFRDEGGLVYVSGKEGFLFVDTHEGVTAYQTAGDIPEKHKAPVDRLTSQDAPGNIYFDPETLWPTNR